eukprot:g1760.t1
MERQIELRKVYGNMEENFKTQNLNLEFISSMGKFYVETGETEVKALPYESPHACRLIVLPMDYTPELAQKLFHAASTVLEVLPKDLKVFQNPAEILHITLFHTSRPDSLMAAELDAKSEQYLINEKEKAQAILEASVKPHLVFDRITLAESGVLLALWVDETEVCFDLRNQLRAEFPDAPSKQTSILHSSLFRIITPSKLEKDIQEKVCEVCHRVSEELACTDILILTFTEIELNSNVAFVIMGRKKRVHKIDSSSLIEEEAESSTTTVNEQGHAIGLPSEKLVSLKVPCTIQAIGGGIGGWFIGYGFNVLNFFSLKTRTLRELNRTGLESGRSLALCSGVFSLALCFCSRLRGKEDVWNGVVAGCATGLITSFQGGPVHALKQCAVFGGGCWLVEVIGNTYFSEAQALSIYEDSSMVNELAKRKERKKLRIESIWDTRWKCKGCQSGLKFLPWTE